jgi:hypothetical protein|tara:strand:- start:4389 stop:10316 length:5928 start_codon:yes stop_codon:yes gene_type:complete
MPLSRLDNFLKNARGNILYVNPNDLDATDSIENQGNSLARPFKTIQRALIEAARFSYQSGLDNDRFNKTTIMLYPGEHIVDNRPGWIPDGEDNFRLRDGTTSDNFSSWSLTTNYDLTTTDNALYKMNSVHGGVIVPRGTSIVGFDLRKTKIRPKYVPNPQNDSIERSAIFRVTGGCYFWQFSIFDGDPNGTVYKDYTTGVFVPNFSHHKLTCFEYADGVNNVKISDAFINNFDAARTDLDMYYEKVGLAYGPSSGREIEPDYPSSGLDIQPKIDEFRIVGPQGGSIGISSIKAGDGVVSTDTITVTLNEALFGLDVDTSFQVEGISDSGYDGQFVVSDVITTDSSGTTVFKYKVSNPPTEPLPTPTGAVVNLQVDTVTSASPYIFNISQRSVFGMCGLLADGSKATGFKSMVVAQFTGIGLQKDKNAFVKYDSTSGEYKDATFTGNENIQTDSRAVYKPAYSNFHIKCENDSILQLVSIFAIGYSQHFVVDTGGDQSLTNSNSNFGSKALNALGFRKECYKRDDVGYITNIIPPKQIESTDITVEFNAIDVYKTAVGVGSTSRFYLYNETNQDVAPKETIQGYRVGAKPDDKIKVLIAGTEYQARIVMPDTELSSTQNSFEKVFAVGRASGINSITSNTFTLTSDHNLIEGESLRVISENGHLPDGLRDNNLYFAITDGVGANQIKVAKTLNDAIEGNPLTINNKGGILKIQSRVSDKKSGDIGHPIQYDVNESNWYLTVGTAATDNNIYSTLVGLGTTAIGSATPRTFITRTPDTRNISDTIYRLRYVIPAGSGITSARPPQDGFVIQDSSDVTGATDTEVAKYYSPNNVSLSNVSELRNFKFIAHAHWSGNVANILTELPHKLRAGAEVKIDNVTSANNPLGAGNSGFNGTFEVAGITSTREFTVNLTSTVGPGTFTNDTTSRTTSLPTFSQSRYPGTYSIYRSQEVQEYQAGIQDGIYNLIVINSSNTPNVAPFATDRYAQPIQFLYPQTNRDNPTSNPRASKTFALPTPIGQTVIDEPQHSLTGETLKGFQRDRKAGFGITAIQSNSAGTAHTIFTDLDHGLNRVVNVSIAESGAGYGSGSAGYIYNAQLVSAGAATTQGEGATARIQINAAGNLVSAKIMHGGSNYEVGEKLQIVGVSTNAPHTTGIVSVTQIYNNIGDVLEVSGVEPFANNGYNTLYEVTGVATDSARRITVSSASTIGNIPVGGIGVTDSSTALVEITGQSLDVTGFSYNATTGIGIVTTAQRHGLLVDNLIKLGGADAPLYRGDFVVKKINSQTSFNVNIGVNTIAPGTSGTIVAYRYACNSQGGNILREDENLGGRQIFDYAGITTTISSAITNAASTTINIRDLENVDLNIGDYLIVDKEVMRISDTVSGTSAVTVFRGVFGTQATTHADESVVRRISCHPVEFRRNSIIRASGHTFEYLGYGPGNYSTALPSRQDRTLTAQEELISQSTKKDGGINVYTGMNDQGDFYVGNKRVSSSTGQEEVFDTPVPSVTGEDIRVGTEGGLNIGFDVLTPLEAVISRSIRVEGGQDGNIISEFDGPVIFNNKITSTSSDGIESASLFLQGDQGDVTVSRKLTVGISTPTLAGNVGDVVFNASPNKAGYAGWIYTQQNGWFRFGAISETNNTLDGIFENVGIATTTSGLNTLQVGAGASLFAVDGTGVGIGTTANNFKIHAIGDARITGTLDVGSATSIGSDVRVSGTVTATAFVGDGSGLENLSNDTLFTPTAAGFGTGIFPTNNLRVGIGTTIPNFPLELGTAGTGTTDLKVHNVAIFDDFISANDVLVGGALTATTYRLDSSTSNITAGIVTASNVTVGTALSTSSGNVGLGTATPRGKLDIEGETRFKTYSENLETLDISSGVVNIDLSKGQSFDLTLDEDVTSFKLLNPPDDVTAFTIRISQNATGNFSVGIATFTNASDAAITVKFAGGGIVPGITTAASATDIYSFMTFDGGSTLFGVTGGQNFA